MVLDIKDWDIARKYKISLRILEHLTNTKILYCRLLTYFVPTQSWYIEKGNLINSKKYTIDYDELYTEDFEFALISTIALCQDEFNYSMLNHLDFWIVVYQKYILKNKASIKKFLSIRKGIYAPGSWTNNNNNNYHTFFGGTFITSR